MQTQTAEQRRAERTSLLNDLLSAAAIRCPDSSAFASAQLLDSSLRHRPADDAHRHRRTMSLLESALAQVRTGATELDLNPPHRQPTVDALRADLERSLPRGPN